MSPRHQVSRVKSLFQRVVLLSVNRQIKRKVFFFHSTICLAKKVSDGNIWCCMSPSTFGSVSVVLVVFKEWDQFQPYLVFLLKNILCITSVRNHLSWTGKLTQLITKFNADRITEHWITKSGSKRIKYQKCASSLEFQSVCYWQSVGGK